MGVLGTLSTRGTVIVHVPVLLGTRLGPLGTSYFTTAMAVTGNRARPVTAIAVVK